MNKKLIIGYTSGVFDLFHIGHLRIIENAKTLCDYLIVGVTTDEITLELKNKLPVISYEERAAIVESIRHVDQVVPNEFMSNLDAWEKLRFDIMIKGDDWKGTERWNELEREFEKVNVQVKYFPYTSHTSSTQLRNALGLANDK